MLYPSVISRMRRRAPPTGGAVQPLFELDFSSGVDRLADSLTINSITETPKLRYRGGDAAAGGWAGWTYGNSLALSGSGTAPSYNFGGPWNGTSDDSILFKAGKSFQASGNSFGDITTDDIVIELVLRPGATVSSIVSKMEDNSLGPGYSVIRIASGGALYFRVYDSGGFSDVISASLVDDCWYHCMCFLDRSGSGQWYVNGAASGSPVSIATRTGSLSSAIPFTIGSDAKLTTGSAATVAYAALWHASGWLDTHLQATVAFERCAYLSGLYPSTVTGTAVPTSAARASSAFLARTVGSGSRVYQLGAGLLRTSDRGASTGLLIESASGQGQQYSPVNGGWTQRGTCSIAAASQVGPTGDTDAARITGLNTGLNDCYKVNGGWGVSRWLGTGVWIKRVSTSGTFIFADANNPTRGQWTIDLSALPDAWVRVTRDHAAVTVDYERTSHTDGWSGAWFQGVSGGALSLDVWQAHLDIETSVTFPNQPSSDIVRPATGAVSRVADTLYYPADDGNVPAAGGSATVVVRRQTSTAGSGTAPAGTILEIDDGGSSADRVVLRVTAAGVAEAYMVATGGTARTVTGTTNIDDDAEHTLIIAWSGSALTLTVDGTSEGTPASCVAADLPNDLDRLYVGSGPAALSGYNGLIVSLRIDA